MEPALSDSPNPAELANKWITSIKWLLALKFIFALAATFGEFRLPQIIRQTDTMSVSLRYWMRWTIESNPQYPLFPALLAAGDGYGIAPTEFPILNMLYAPFFALQIQWARPAAWIAHVLLSALLTIWHYRLWKGKRVLGINAGHAALLLPLVSVSSVFSGRFMPDYIAFLLFSSAIALSWDRDCILKSFPLALLATLIKPPVILAAGLFFLINRKRWLGLATWILPVILIVGWYYKFGMSAVKAVSDFPPYFLTDLRDPLQSLRDFFGEPKQVINFLFKDILAPPYLIVLILGVIAARKLGTKYAALFGVLIVQIVAGAALDGIHSFMHIYYFIGSALVCSLILIGVMVEARINWLPPVVFISILAMQIEQGVYEFGNVVEHFRGDSQYSQCSKLKTAHPEFPWNKSYHFRSEFSYVSELGLCFGEIQNATKAEFGFMKVAAQIPSDCERVDGTENLNLIRCKPR